MRKIAALLLLAATLASTLAAASDRQRRVLTPDDVNALHSVSDPQISPDGEWVAYTLQSADLVQDKSVTHVWMASWDGRRHVQLTYSGESEHTPRWSPDGKYLAFLAARGAQEATAQVWLLDRLGGEAKPLTSFDGDVVDFAWSPDGKRLALIVADADSRRPKPGEEHKTQPPVIIDRYYFKEDKTGYLDARRQHLHVFDVATRKSQLLTPGKFDEGWPAWSPEGTQIAFYSNRSLDPDRTSTFGLYVIAPKAGATPRLVASFQGDAGDSSWMTAPSWRPDGREIAFVTAGDPKLIYYSTTRLAVAPVAGGGARILTQALDRNVQAPRWSPDGDSIYFLLEDDRNQHLARLALDSGKIERVVEGRRESTQFDASGSNRIAVIDSTVDRPAALYALDGLRFRALTAHNDEWLANVQLGSVEEIEFSSADGTRIGGFIVKPPGYVPGRRYPTLLWIHGGPALQYANAFTMTWQVFAAHGYAVIGVNPRGSTGRGEAFSTAIYADWGDKDATDVLAAVDYAVRQGIADPERLGVGGWSYGGILTNFVIAKDSRFKSATSGAGMGNTLAGYGTDMYIREYEAELGPPWTNLDAWLRTSYPLLHADRIRTPTLFLCGERDFNVPLLSSEQMYQALRSLGVDTQLVIYPGQYHGLTKPSYMRDRMQRYLDWHGKYLQSSRAE